MARIFDACFEPQSITAEGMTVVGIAPTFDAVNMFDGTACAKFAKAAENRATYSFTGANGTSYFARFAVRMSSVAPSANVELMRFVATGNLAPTVLTNGKIGLWNSKAAANVVSEVLTLEKDKWYEIEVKMKTEAAGNGTAAMRIWSEKGVELYASGDKSVELGNTAPTAITVGHIGGETNADVLVSHMVMNDSTGASQTSYPGFEKVVELPPIEDNANTGFSDAAASTEKLWEAVDNRPPIGVSAAAPGLPEVRAVGEYKLGTAAVSPGLPASTAAGDLLIMIAESAGADVVLTASGWSQLETKVNGDTRMTILYKIAAGADATTTNDTGDHQQARIIGIKAGTFDPVTPFHKTAYGEQASTKAVSHPTLTTTLANCLILACSTGDLPDGTTTAEFSGETNASLASLTERVDNTCVSGNGGALYAVTGTKASAGVVSATTATAVNAAARAVAQLAIAPLAIVAKAQIGTANNNNTDAYKATLKSYIEAGIGAGDTIKVVKPRARIGNSTTTARNSGLKGISNPEITEGEYTMAAAAAATEPTGWQLHSGNVAYEPSVTKETKPVIQIRKATASTDRFVVDFMGLIVSYVPSKGEAYVETLAETITGTDALGPKAVGKVLGETVTGTDKVTNAVKKILAGETLTGTDALKNAVAKILAGETITGTDALGPKAVAKVLAETLTGTDAVKTVAAYIKTLAETITGTDAVKNAVAKALAETITGTDKVGPFTVVKALAETLTGTDAVTKAFQKILTGETLTGSDAVKRAVAKVLAETLTGTDSVVKAAAKALAETITASDSISKTKSTSLTAASETDTAQALRHTRYRSLVAALATDTAQALVVTKPIVRSLTGVSETDEALALSVGASKVIQAAAETDTALALTVRQPTHYALTAATILDSAQALAHARAIEIEAASESDQAAALTYRKQISITAATEIDAAEALSVSTPFKSIVAAEETDLAEEVSGTKFVTLAVATETSEASALSTSVGRVIQPATETNTAEPLSVTKTIFRSIEPAKEKASSAGVLKPAKRVTVVGVVETATAEALMVIKGGRSIKAAKETSTALHLFNNVIVPIEHDDYGYSRVAVVGESSEPTTGRIAKGSR